MSRIVSAAFQQAVNSQTTNEVFTVLLTISHESFIDDIRICSDPAVLLPVAGVRGVVSRGDEFIYLPFEVVFPSQDDSGISNATIVTDNVDRTIIAAIRGADSPVDITVELVLSSDPDTVEASVENFRLEGVTYNSLTVSGQLSVEYFDLEPFPKGRFTPSEFPGIF